jgi:hypothetical protein
VIAVHSNSFRTIRGRTLIAAIFDEVAFWRDETSATPEIETYRAVLPSLATTNGMLIGISTPYRKLGLLHQKYRDYFGVDHDDVLVVQGGAQTFNSTLSEQTKAYCLVTVCVCWNALKTSGFSAASHGSTFLSSGSCGLCRITITCRGSICPLVSRALRSQGLGPVL